MRLFDINGDEYVVKIIGTVNGDQAALLRKVDPHWEEADKIYDEMRDERDMSNE